MTSNDGSVIFTVAPLDFFISNWIGYCFRLIRGTGCNREGDKQLLAANLYPATHGDRLTTGVSHDCRCPYWWRII